MLIPKASNFGTLLKYVSLTFQRCYCFGIKRQRDLSKFFFQKKILHSKSLKIYCHLKKVKKTKIFLHFFRFSLLIVEQDCLSFAYFTFPFFDFPL